MAAHQNCSSDGHGREKYKERLMSWDKDKERSLTDDHHGQGTPDLVKLAKFVTNQKPKQDNKK